MSKRKNLKRAWNKIKSPQFWQESRYISYYEKLPIDDHTILLEAEHGIMVEGNIYYMLKHILADERYRNYRVCLSAKTNKMEAIRMLLDARGITGYELVEHRSREYLKLLASAKYIATDTSMHGQFIKKPGQVLLNTWHGTPLKCLGKKSASEFDGMGNVQRSFAMADLLLYPNRFTKNHLVEDYFLENMACGSTVLCGYPRNQAFFDPQLQQQIREELELAGKRVYAFMPTYRGIVSGVNRNIGSQKNNCYLLYYLYELDKRLEDDEILFVNLHPFVKNSVALEGFAHIRPFPANYETYEFLSIAECLVTDYSSVFFDFASSGKKVVLFPYDLEEYMENRGVYLDIRDLPFPKVFDVDSLLSQLRAPKDYDDTAFMQTFCAYDGYDATAHICDLWLRGENSGNLEVEKIADNGKENVLLFAGDLARNGITTSLRNLLNSLDHTKRNYFIAFYQAAVKKNRDSIYPTIGELPFIAYQSDMNVTFLARCIRKLFKQKLLSAKTYVKLNRKYIQSEAKRLHGNMRIDAAVQFNGYDTEVNLMYSQLNARTTLFVHNDMEREIATKGNQRRDCLRFGYNTFDKTAIVSDEILPPTARIKGTQEGIFTVHNLINVSEIQKKASMPIDFSLIKQTSMEKAEFEAFFASSSPKFITIGRYSPEKNHEMLIRSFHKLIADGKQDAKLVIIGGYNKGGNYEKALNVIKELHLEDKVLLILSTPNPYPILNACDFFVLTSLYEGLPLVISEADILGKSQICTNIPGPRGFMNEHGGKLVEISEEAICQGMQELLDGKIAPMNIDFDAYNAQALREFEDLLH